MYDAGKILAGLATFVVLVATPFWWNAARGADTKPPRIERPVAGTTCVLPPEEMRHEHMRLLLRWRDEVVRRDLRTARDAAGRPLKKSLSESCLACHRGREKSCDRCHDWLDVRVYCWDCHSDVGARPAAVAGGR